MFSTVRTLLFGGLAGKLLGVFRELISAALLGTGRLASAFRLSQAAFLIPIQGFIADALTSGFTPQYSRDRHRDRANAARLFAGMHAVIAVFSIVVGGNLLIFATYWVHLLAPGFDHDTFVTAVSMVRSLAFAMPLYALTALYAAAELAAGRAGMSAARATVQRRGSHRWRCPRILAPAARAHSMGVQFRLSCACRVGRASGALRRPSALASRP